MSETTIIRRPDGSIDTARYVAEGRAGRSEAAREVAGATCRAARRRLGALARLWKVGGGAKLRPPQSVWLSRQLSAKYFCRATRNGASVFSVRVRRIESELR
jgi:hypothetical protein